MQLDCYWKYDLLIPLSLEDYFCKKIFVILTNNHINDIAIIIGGASMRDEIIFLIIDNIFNNRRYSIWSFGRLYRFFIAPYEYSIELEVRTKSKEKAQNFRSFKYKHNINFSWLRESLLWYDFFLEEWSFAKIFDFLEVKCLDSLFRKHYCSGLLNKDLKLWEKLVIV